MLQKLITLVIVTIISLPAFSNSKLIYANKKTKFSSENFYILEKKSSKKIHFDSLVERFSDNKDCRNNIQSIICLVNPVAPGQGSEERECLKGGEKYAFHFENLYDNYPESFQRIFCSLNVINIEKEFPGSAYAGTMIDENGNLNGAMLGIRKSVLDENLGLARWASWKEQLSFGGVKDDYQINPELPLITSQSKHDVNDFLFYLVAHEFGHIFDFSNNINEFENCGPNPGDECESPKKGSWAELSWLSDRKVKAEDDFYKRNGLCFYWCQGSFILRHDTMQLYDELYSSSFISTYAASNPYEDFAESMAYIALETYLESTYIISFDGEVFDIISKLKMPVFKEKRTYINDFLSRPNIIYP